MSTPQTPVALQPQVAALVGNIANWLKRNGFPLRDFTTQYGAPQGAVSTDAGDSLPGQVYINPADAGVLGAVAKRRGARTGLNPNQLQAVRALMHESLHQMRYGRTPDFYSGQAVGTPGGNEEGATEAVARDLIPIFVNKMFGGENTGFGAMRLGAGTGYAYPEQVQNVRQLSTFGSGAKRFTDYKARVWRRAFLHADAPTREQMVQQATAARAAWGARAGR